MQTNKKRIIITEGNFDQFFLEKVLPKTIVDESTFIVGQGYSSLISKAKSISLYNNLPIYLIMDSDSTDLFEINERKESIQSTFKMLGKQDQINIFFFIPQLEIVFLQSENFRENHFKNIDLNLISTTSLNNIIKQNFGDRKYLLNKIEDQEIYDFQKDGPIKDLITLLKNDSI
ncbi:hypothetical protein [Chryseobacterium sp. MEBOG07]|uniref:hypothetical protein n=1 Tax=Chryseobacterium sp. MEBOG07 TaxID=2879939 RepID=UPI001F4119A6|nr:hypothetical protein [Chryseobacterium sp. MEBOG07]UKB80335.1 hypothetical protein LF886_04860 [Chryseobacterium sp. MEBOG07]